MRFGLVAAVLFSCSPMMTQKPAPTVEPLPSFELADVNPASATTGQSIGPLALRGKVTGWYFTHSN